MSELVVLLDAAGRPCGSAPKSEVHHDRTPLHLAFSCWVFDGHGRTLLTRRAAVKRTWPGAWTNSFCGHPAPAEAMADAIHRRAADELGATVAEPRVLLADFRYSAVMDDGTVENEVCPVYATELLTQPTPDPAEVADLTWVPFDDLPGQVLREPGRFSPWMLEQLSALGELAAPSSSRP